MDLLGKVRFILPERAKECQIHYFQDIVTSLQKHNLDNAIGGKTPPASFLKNKEPKSLAGKNKGLVVVLDSHVDQVSLALFYKFNSPTRVISAIKAKFISII